MINKNYENVITDRNEKINYTNFKRANRLYGIIDYKTVSILLIYLFILIELIKKLNFSFEVSLYILSFMVIPVIALLLVNQRQENAIDVLIFIIKFIFQKKIFTRATYDYEYDFKKYE